MYPIKYLNEFFVPNGSYLETNILLTSVSDKYRNLSEEEKIKRENMEERDTVACLKKRNKN